MIANLHPSGTVDPNRLVQKGRDEFERRSWRSAHDSLASARAATALQPADLWRLALASFLAGREDDFVQSLHELHSGYRKSGDARAAARSAIWLALHLEGSGSVAQATGWFARARRLLDREEEECAEHGYLLLPEARQLLLGGNGEGAALVASEAVALGQRCDDAELLTLALHLEGCALLRCGRIEEGLARLDEAMVGVLADELSPQVSGLVYCSVIYACREVWALQRVREWTARLADWCDAQPDMVAYTGECRVYRAEALLQRGEWHDALAEARRALERFAAGSVPPATGLAHYLEGEAHRLRGEHVAAERAYRAAGTAGYMPHPGLALLRLSQGEGDAAAAAIERALGETSDRARRARLLSAGVEIALERDDIDGARRALDELAAIARSCGSSVMNALLAQARGTTELAAGNATDALVQLRTACDVWQAFDAPYDAGRTRELLGRACRALGDDDGAALELQAARAAYARLGASDDASRLDALMKEPGSRDTHGLTPREREVIALLATGRTNRAIALALRISEKTVARHVSNIFTKLGISSRAAATAYAYEHRMLDM